MASRQRKRHVQLEMPRLDKNGQRRGGKRAGAGRPPKGPRSSAPHTRRAELKPAYPQHVTLRVARGVRWLRGWKAFAAIRRALAVSIDTHADFRICQFSLQGDHLHLLCEAADRLALARGVQGFEISAARQLNRALGRRGGTIFPDRYHVEPIRTVAHVRHALSYVLNNWRKHRQDREIRGLYEGRLDPFSSAVWFAGFRERTQAIAIPPDYEPPRVAAAQSWLLREGWKRARPISVYAVPGGGEEP
ncbi:MAG: transposase [Acidobacteriota bacterium]